MIKFDGLDLNTELFNFEIINENQFGISDFIIDNQYENNINFDDFFRQEDFDFFNNKDINKINQKTYKYFSEENNKKEE